MKKCVAVLSSAWPTSGFKLRDAGDGCPNRTSSKSERQIFGIAGVFEILAVRFGGGTT
jgi:hypothetical protein